MSSVTTAFTVLAYVFTMLTYFSPLITFVDIWRSGSTVGYFSIPYIMSWFSAAMAVYYGCLTHDRTAQICHSIGLGAQFGFVCWYLWYPPRINQIMARYVSAFFIFLAVVSIGVSYFAFYTDERVAIVEWISSLATLFSFFGPLYGTLRAYRDRDVEHMSIVALLVFSALSAAVRGISALLAEFPVELTLITSAIGFVIALVQLVLYFIIAYSKALDLLFIHVIQEMSRALLF